MFVDYTREDLLRDMDMLRKAGLIEVVGVNPDGEWLWAPTQKSLSMTKEERANIVFSIIEDGYIDE